MIIKLLPNAFFFVVAIFLLKLSIEREVMKSGDGGNRKHARKENADNSKIYKTYKLLYIGGKMSMWRVALYSSCVTFFSSESLSSFLSRENE